MSEVRRTRASWRGFQSAEFYRESSAPARARARTETASLRRTARCKGVSRKGRCGGRGRRRSSRCVAPERASQTRCGSHPDQRVWAGWRRIGTVRCDPLLRQRNEQGCACSPQTLSPETMGFAHPYALWVCGWLLEIEIK
jgi:hypothetical protein